MRPSWAEDSIAVFDIGGTWFRWGLYDSSRGLREFQRAPAINYLLHPELSAADLQLALAAFIVEHVQELGDQRTVSVSLGAPINAHDMTVLGSGPLWGPEARPFNLYAHLHKALPHVQWHIVNDITALLAPYMDEYKSCRKTMLITVSSGIGSRLYDHQARRIPYDEDHGVQGEIGHLVFPFQLDGKLVNRQCECGGWNHMNAFSSGRGIAQTLLHLPELTSNFNAIAADSISDWQNATDAYRLKTFQSQLDMGMESAAHLLDALVTPLARALAAALALDPDIDRIVITGGVAHGLGTHYREALERTFLRDGLYQISERDPRYLTRRLVWEDADDFAGLRGAGIYAARLLHIRIPESEGTRHGAANRIA